VPPRAQGNRSGVVPLLDRKSSGAKEKTVKGLMFNLLEKMAQDAGCRDEAWELVVEFAAAEGFPSANLGPRAALQDAQPLRIFEVPTEAMLRCLARDRTPDPQASGWDLFELSAFGNDFESDPLRCLDLRAPEPGADFRTPYCGGVGAFVETDAGTPEHRAAALLDTDEGLDEVYRVFGLGLIKQ
jgi:hypothetical protein